MRIPAVPSPGARLPSSPHSGFRGACSMVVKNRAIVLGQIQFEFSHSQPQDRPQKHPKRNADGSSWNGRGLYFFLVPGQEAFLKS